MIVWTAFDKSFQLIILSFARGNFAAGFLSWPLAIIINGKGKFYDCTSTHSSNSLTPPSHPTGLLVKAACDNEWLATVWITAAHAPDLPGIYQRPGSVGDFNDGDALLNNLHRHPDGPVKYRVRLTAASARASTAKATTERETDISNKD